MFFVLSSADCSVRSVVFLLFHVSFISVAASILLRLVGSLDQHLDRLALLDLLEGLLGLLEVDNARHELLHINLASGNQLDGQRVVTGAVSERTADSGLLDAHGHDGEGNVRLAHATLHVAATDLEDVDTGLDRGLGTAGVNDNVGTVREVGKLEDVLGVLLGGDALGGVDVGSSKALGKVELGLDNVDTDNLGGTVGAGDGGAEETDGTSTHDDNRVAGLDLGLLDDVDTDGEGLNQGTLLLGDVVGQLEAEVGRGTPVAGEGTVVGRSGGKDHVGAEVVLASEAVGAAAAGVSGLEGDAVADLEGLHLVTDLDDSAGRLMTQDHGVCDDELANGAMDPVVDVGAADTSVVDGDEDIVGILEGGLGALLEGNVAGLIEDERQVLESVSWSLERGGQSRGRTLAIVAMI